LCDRANDGERKLSILASLRLLGLGSLLAPLLDLGCEEFIDPTYDTLPLSLVSGAADLYAM